MKDIFLDEEIESIKNDAKSTRGELNKLSSTLRNSQENEEQVGTLNALYGYFATDGFRLFGERYQTLLVKES